MSGFSADWLGLREPADAAARSADVTAFVGATLATRPSARCLDLGAGTGANVRYLSTRLPVEQHWCLVDDDEALLSGARSHIDIDVETRSADLRRLDPALLEGQDLVTASALLDLVSGNWIDTLVALSAAAGSATLFALNYDGRVMCTPRDESDDLVRDLVNVHQRRDKGFGPALGPDAARHAEQQLREAGYTVRAENSDWHLGGAHASLQRELLQGWASAACETAPEECERIDGWLTRRLALVRADRSQIVVGHVDVAGVRSRG